MSLPSFFYVKKGTGGGSLKSISVGEGIGWEAIVLKKMLGICGKTAGQREVFLWISDKNSQTVHNLPSFYGNLNTE